MELKSKYLKMKIKFFIIASLLLWGGGDIVSAERPGPTDFSKIVQPLLPSVVNISTTTEIKQRDRQSYGIPQFPDGSQLEELFRHFFERPDPDAPGSPRKATSLGSGFIVSQEGKEAFIVTCNHVIDEANEIKVVLNDNTELKATVVGRDHRTDLALLKVKTDKKLTVAEWGNSNDVKVGQWVIAIGNPFGLASTVTVGIVSTIARDINARGRSGLSADYVEGYLQTDASINMGNSGGPQFNTDGKVIAISTAIFSPNGGNIGIGFGIPSDAARQVISQLKEFGRTKRGYLGVRVQPVTEEIAQSLGLKKVYGALVAEVTPKGPAAKVGIKSGDVILRFNGVDVKESRNLPRIVGESSINKETSIVVWRNGREHEFKVVVGEFEQAESEENARKGLSNDKMKKSDKKILGMILKPVTPILVDRFRLAEDTKGVIVAFVDPRSEAAEKGVAAGDVISEMRFKNETIIVNQPQQVDELVHKLIKSLPAVDQKEDVQENKILFLINRRGSLRYLPLKVSHEKEEKKRNKETSSEEEDENPDAKKSGPSD